MSFRMYSSGLSSNSSTSDSKSNRNSFERRKSKRKFHLEEINSAESLVHKRFSTSRRPRTSHNDDFELLISTKTSSPFQQAEKEQQNSFFFRSIKRQITSSNDGERFNRVNKDQIAMANCGANGLNSSL